MKISGNKRKSVKMSEYFSVNSRLLAVPVPVPTVPVHTCSYLFIPVHSWVVPVRGRSNVRITRPLEIIGSPRREAIDAAEDGRAPKLAGETVEGPLPTALPVPRSGAGRERGPG